MTIGYLVVSYGMATVFKLLFEDPYLALVKTMFKTIERKGRLRAENRCHQKNIEIAKKMTDENFNV